MKLKNWKNFNNGVCKPQYWSWTSILKFGKLHYWQGVCKPQYWSLASILKFANSIIDKKSVQTSILKFNFNIEVCKLHYWQMQTSILKFNFNIEVCKLHYWQIQTSILKLNLQYSSLASILKFAKPKKAIILPCWTRQGRVAQVVDQAFTCIELERSTPNATKTWMGLNEE